MNNLSWMIYLAGVAEGLQAVLILGALVGSGATAIICVAEEEFTKAAKRTLTIAAVAAMLAVFLPGKQAVYAIAASEFGEEALKTPEANKARAALNAWLDKQISQKPEKEESK